MAVQCENCSLEPLLGKVLEIYTDVGELEIVWLEGALTKHGKCGNIETQRTDDELLTGQTEYLCLQYFCLILN